MIHRLIDMKTNDVVLRPIRSSLLILVPFSFYGRLTPRQLCCLVRMSSDEIGKQNKSYGHSCGEEEVIRFFCLVDEGGGWLYFVKEVLFGFYGQFFHKMQPK